jgi:hypothetical protein
VLTQLTRRVFGLGVSIFATLGFLAVPLGDKTGFQHAKSIAMSSEAQRFRRELWQAAMALKQRLLTEARVSERDANSERAPELLRRSPLPEAGLRQSQSLLRNEPAICGPAP